MQVQNLQWNFIFILSVLFSVNQFGRSPCQPIKKNYISLLLNVPI